MDGMLLLTLVVVLAALVFEFINGFHDTANSIATVVATKVLSPMQAVGLAASMNLVGALAGTAVAKTIASGLIDAGVVEVGSQLILSDAARSRWRASLKASSAGTRSSSRSISWRARAASWPATAASSSSV